MLLIRYCTYTQNVSGNFIKTMGIFKRLFGKEEKKIEKQESNKNNDNFEELEKKQWKS